MLMHSLVAASRQYYIIRTPRQPGSDRTIAAHVSFIVPTIDFATSCAQLCNIDEGTYFLY